LIQNKNKMLEFKEYDKGFFHNESKLETKKMPLVTWDLYGDFLSQLNKIISDQNQLELLATFNSWKTDFNLNKLIDIDTVVVVTCPNLKIVFSTKNMVRMNGYHPEEVLGKSPKMFQGPATCVETSKEIGDAVRNRLPFEKVVTNYCKDGSLYQCHIKGFPVFNKSGELTNFIAFEKAA
jgi:PAS domain S-box-containing protein